MPIIRFQSFLAPLIRQYLDFRKSLGYSVTERDFYMFRDIDYYALWRGISRPEQIDEPFVAGWVFVTPSHTASTKNTRLTFIRAFCRYLVRLGVIKDNPALRVLRLRQNAFHPHIYTLKELETLLQAADQWKSRSPSFRGWALGTLIHLIYACGLRLGEALNLKLRDIDFTEDTLSLWKTKFHKERLVPFSPQLRKRLQRHFAERAKRFPDSCAPHEYVFCNRRGKYSTQGTHHLFRQLLKRCGLAKSRGPRIHDLRHTFAVHRLYKWYQDGDDILNKLPLLSTYMGHVSIESTRVYLTICRALLREGNRRFRQHWEDIPLAALKKALKKNAAC